MVKLSGFLFKENDQLGTGHKRLSVMNVTHLKMAPMHTEISGPYKPWLQIFNNINLGILNKNKTDVIHIKAI